MSSAALVSLDESLHRSEKPLCEYIDGVLNPKPMLTSLRRQNVEALAEVTFDPLKQTGWQYHSGGEPERVERGGALQTGAVSVGLEDLFAEVDA
jgi:hypothetical protein